MSVRKAPVEGLTVRQRLTLFHGTALTAEEALSHDEDGINFDMMLKNGVKAVNITAAGLRPLALKKHGVEEAVQLRRLGFDALHLVDPVLCNEANAAYGAQAVICAFLNSPQDAVALAGSEAVSTLNLTLQQLLEACAGAPTEAQSVLQQCSDQNPLSGLSAKILLDTGLRAPQLKQMGYNLLSIKELSCVGPQDLGKLGFTL